jgi:hypothetical protein
MRAMASFVTVDEAEPVPTGASEREHDADDVATVAAEHKREFPVPQHTRDCCGKLHCISPESVGIEDLSLGISVRVVRRRFNSSGLLGVQPGQEASSLERLGETLDAVRF